MPRYFSEYIHFFIIQSWQRIPNPLYYADHITYPIPFSNFVPTLPLASNLHPNALFVALFLWLNACSHHIWCYFIWRRHGSTHAKPWYFSTRRTLLCVLCNVKFTEVLHMWFFASTIIWYHTDKDIQHTQGPIEWHTHINIYQHQNTHTHAHQTLRKVTMEKISMKTSDNSHFWKNSRIIIGFARESVKLFLWLNHNRTWTYFYI